MSYTIDVYRGDARAIRNPIDFGATCRCSRSSWPGRSSVFRMWPTSSASDPHDREVHPWLAFLGLGLGKKILLANPCGKVADMAFDAGSVGCLDAWVGAVAYAFQIYFDFSGYCDMAIGLGLMLGFVFAKNFDSPVPQPVHHRILAALALEPLDLAARLPLLSARRQSQGPRADLRQPDAGHAPWRAVAWGLVELRGLGRRSTA